MLMMRTVTPSVFAESLRAGPPGPHRPPGPPDVSPQGAGALRPQLVAGGNSTANISGEITAKGTPAVADANTPHVLEPSGSQWAIKVPDGRVIPTGTSQERTERDVEWENNHPHGRGGCIVVVRDAYKTPWRLADDPAPVVTPGPEAAMTQATEMADLQAQVAHLGDLVLYYRHLAAQSAETHPLPPTHAPDRRAPTRQRLRLATSQN